MRILLLLIFWCSAFTCFGQYSHFHNFRTQGAGMNAAFNAGKEENEVSLLSQVDAQKTVNLSLQGHFNWKNITFQSGLLNKHSFYRKNWSAYIGAARSFKLGDSKLGLGANLRYNSPKQPSPYFYSWRDSYSEPIKTVGLDFGMSLTQNDLVWGFSFNGFRVYTPSDNIFAPSYFPRSATMSLLNTSHFSKMDLCYGTELKAGGEFQGTNFLVAALFAQKFEIGTGLQVADTRFHSLSPKLNVGYRFNRLRPV